MDLTKDYYDILRIKKDADPIRIKLGYLKQAFKNHPDQSPDFKKEAAQKVFKEIIEAYYILSDEQRREQYDVERKKALEGGVAFDFYFGQSATSFDDVAFEEFFKVQLAEKFAEPWDLHRILGGYPAKITAATFLVILFFSPVQSSDLHQLPLIANVPLPFFIVVVLVIWDTSRTFMGINVDDENTDTIFLALCWVFILTVMNLTLLAALHAK